jgi:hypothetical protein
MAGREAQMVEHLPSRYNALSSNPNTIKYIYVYVYIYTHIHTYIYTYIYIHIHTHIYTYIHIEKGDIYPKS